MNQKEIYQTAHAYLADKKNWVQYPHSDYHWTPTLRNPFKFTKVTGRCAVQAIIHTPATPSQASEAIKNLRNYLPEGYSSVQMYNDDRHTKHADILQLFKRAIE